MAEPAEESLPFQPLGPKRQPAKKSTVPCDVCLEFFSALALGTLTIVFSQVFPWDADATVCDPTNVAYVRTELGSFVAQPVKCRCQAEFPMYVLISGILMLVGGFLRACEALNPLAVACRIANFGIGIVLFVRMFESDRACGESLWDYGIFLLVLSCLGAVVSCCCCNGIGKSS